MNATAAAREKMGRDHDVDDSISCHLPRDTAYALLKVYGFNWDGAAWIDPEGNRYWETDEALTMALVARGIEG